MSQTLLYSFRPQVVAASTTCSVDKQRRNYGPPLSGDCDEFNGIYFHTVGINLVFVTLHIGDTDLNDLELLLKSFFVLRRLCMLMII